MDEILQEPEIEEEPLPTTESEPDTPPRPSVVLRLLRQAVRPENALRLAFMLGSVAAYLMVEYLNGNDPFTAHHPGQVFFNIVWYLIIFMMLRLPIGRTGISAAVSAAVCFGIGLANHYVLSFRGRTIFPCDLLSLQTAINVAGDYDYSWTKPVWTAFAILVGYWLLLALAGLLCRRKGRQKLRRRTILFWGAAILIWCYVFFLTPLLPTIGIWAQQWKTQSNGFILNFTAALRYSIVSEPEGYSSEEAEKIAEKAAQLEDPEVSEAGRPENLIVIMNESFSDMQEAFPQLELSEDPLEYFHSLTENTIRGSIIVPVTGGGTANVEYEFLTGGSLAFLPEGTVAYQLYLYDGIPNLAAQTGKLGYRNVAFHPYLSSGWNRTAVYPWMGFHQQLYDEDVAEPYMIRNYISDSSDYRELYRLTEENEQPTFIFNVTMQNHSGYSQGWNNLPRTVTVTGGGKKTSAATQYFSLLDQSDDALRELIEYYSACDEKTMIVFFGDHQPPLGNDFYEQLYGKVLDDRTTEEIFQQYRAPFFIWANYDIPEAEDILISSNYLSVLTAQAAGFELTEFQTMLADLMEVLPVCSRMGYQTADGTLYEKEEELPEKIRQKYEDYRLMAYNLLFDEDNHPEDFYE